MCISVQRTQNISAIISATNKSNFGYYEKQFRHFGFGADHLLSEAISANIISLYEEEKYNKKIWKEKEKQTYQEIQETNTTDKLIAQISTRLDHIENSIGSSLLNCS